MYFIILAASGTFSMKLWCNKLIPVWENRQHEDRERTETRLWVCVFPAWTVNWECTLLPSSGWITKVTHQKRWKYRLFQLVVEEHTLTQIVRIVTIFGRKKSKMISVATPTKNNPADLNTLSFLNPPKRKQLLLTTTHYFKVSFLPLHLHNSQQV